MQLLVSLSVKQVVAGSCYNFLYVSCACTWYISGIQAFHCIRICERFFLEPFQNFVDVSIKCTICMRCGMRWMTQLSWSKTQQWKNEKNKMGQTHERDQRCNGLNDYNNLVYVLNCSLAIIDCLGWWSWVRAELVKLGKTEKKMKIPLRFKGSGPSILTFRHNLRYTLKFLGG